MTLLDKTLLDDLLTALVLIAGFYILFFIGKLVNDLLNRDYKLTHELVERDNPALAVAVAGYYLGLVFAIGGALVGPSRGIVEDLIDLVIYGALAIILLNLSWLLCDRLILRKFKVVDELIRDQNPGTGAVSFGVSVASGLIVYGAVTGQGGTIWTAIGFWAVGQLILVIAGLMYDRITPYDVHAEIERDNVAAGVSFGGAMAAMGIVVGFAASRDFTSWAEDLPGFSLIALCGLVMLPLVRFLTDRVLLPTVTLTDEIVNQKTPNVGAAFIEALSYVSGAFVISWCL
jgi:uncharacterized membrane protein YjfL (UPF0719 family)